MDVSTLMSEKDILQLVSLKEVFAGFAHEIAQPLNAIMIASQVLQLRVQRGSLSEDEKSFLVTRLGIISSQVQRATQIVDTLRSFSKPMTSDSAVADMRASFESVYALMGQQFVGRGLELVWKSGADLPPVKADTHLVQLILVQALAFARDSVEAIAEWHEHGHANYKKSVSAELVSRSGRSAARIAWQTGQMPEDSEILHARSRVGLDLSESLLGSIGGSLVSGPSSILIAFP